MERDSLKELACSEALNEISNSEDGIGIDKEIRRAGMVKDGRTRRAVLFVIFQTGRFGPQNGFRLALVQEGVKPEDAMDQLKGTVEQDAAEFVVVRPS